MFFKKLFAISLASAIFSSNFSNISLANQRNDVSIYAEPQMRVEKGLDNDEAKSTKSFKFSGPKAKLDLFQGDNLDIALGQGLRFILDDTQSNYVDDKKSLNEFILKNPLVVECILSTERYLNENEDSQTDRQVELLRRLYSLKILMEIDENIQDTNGFYRFVSSMMDAYKVLISRELADEILEQNRKDIESKLSTESASKNVSVSATASSAPFDFGISVGFSNEEGATEKDFYRISNSANLSISVGVGLKGYLGASLENKTQFTRSLIFLSLEQFLDTDYKDGKITTIELSDEKVKETINARKEMQKNEKKLLSNMKTSIEWYLKIAEVIPQNTKFIWPNITTTKDNIHTEDEIKNTISLSSYAKFLASLGFKVSTDAGVTFTNIPHSYLSLIDEDCAPSDYVRSADDIVKFLKQSNGKKFKEIKALFGEYLNEEGNFVGDMAKEEQVISIILSNLIGDIRHYNFALSILSDASIPKENKEDARKIKHKIESNWIHINFLKTNKGRLEILKAAIAIAAYLREYATTRNEIGLFEKLYDEIEYLSKMQVFSRNKKKQASNFETDIKRAYKSLNGNINLTIPMVGEAFVDVSYCDNLSDCKFDTSKDLTLKIQLPIVNERVVGTETVKNKIIDIIEKISAEQELDEKTIEVLNKTVSLLEKKYDSMIEDLGIEKATTIPLVFSINAYLNLNFYLTKIDATKENEELKALPGETEATIKINDEWVLKLIKRVDSNLAKVKLNAGEFVKINASSKLSKASSQMGSDTFQYIVNKYNAFETGLNEKAGKNNTLWDTFKETRAPQIKEMLRNLSDKDKNIHYELQIMYNDIAQNIDEDSKLSATQRKQLMGKVDLTFKSLIESCEKFSLYDSEEDFELASKYLDDVLNLNYYYSYMPELDRIFYKKISK